jgi:hypothetical protein
MSQGNQFYRIDHDATRNLVRLSRTAVPFPSLAETKQAYDDLSPQLQKFAGARLLLDFSGGPPGRNDDAFEQLAAPARTALERVFSRVAVLIRSRAGELQVRRLAKQEGRTPNVFSDEAAALEWLTHE